MQCNFSQDAGLENPPRGFDHFKFPLSETDLLVASQADLSITNAPLPSHQDSAGAPRSDEGRFLRIEAVPFRSTLAQGPFGSLDHVKWLVYNAPTPYDVPKRGTMTCSLTARALGTNLDAHPFGDEVKAPDSDPRMFIAGLSVIDTANLLLFDFLLTNGTVYAWYERLPFMRPVLGDYGAFSYAIPVARRTPAQFHELAIRLDRGAGTVAWLLDGVEVHRIDRVGHGIARQFKVIDMGGNDALVFPEKVNVGFGIFTLLDAHPPCSMDGQVHSGRPLVLLSQGGHCDPRSGEPIDRASFVDPEAKQASRDFGQGGVLDVKAVSVTTDGLDI